MKISSVNISTTIRPVIQKRGQITKNRLCSEQPDKISFLSLKTAGKGAVLGGAIGAVLFATAGAALPLVAMMAVEEAVLGGAIGSLVKDDESEDSSSD